MKEIIGLHQTLKGQTFRIHHVPCGRLRAQFLRIGLCEGDCAHCLEHLPGGTIVLRKKRLEVAIGHALAQQILVQLDENEDFGNV